MKLGSNSNIHFVMNASGSESDHHTFKKIQKSEIEKILPKPKNKFVIARGIISRLIRKNSTLNKMEDLSKVASLIWKKERNKHFGKYFSYLSKMDEDSNSRLYEDLVKRNKSKSSKFCNSTVTTIGFALHNTHGSRIHVKINPSVHGKRFRFKGFGHNSNKKIVPKVDYLGMKDLKTTDDFTYSKLRIDPFSNVEMEDVFLFKNLTNYTVEP